MEREQHLERLRLEGEALAAAASSGPLSLPVPSCPGWDVEALLRHIGDVHRWAATVVRDRLPERLHRDFDGPGDPDALLAWYREGLAELIAVLTRTPTGDTFWAWGPAPSPVEFWCRRQAHETAIHRWDAQAAHGEPDGFPGDVAIDGIDEWLYLAARRAHVPAGHGRTLHVHATDGEGEWLVVLDERLTVRRGHEKGDCALRGPASDLWLWAMNRRRSPDLEVHGDASLLDLWATTVRF